MVMQTKQWKRVVVKVGSALIAPSGERCSTKYLLALADYLHILIAQGSQLVIVSSGSVAAGAGVTGTSMTAKLSIEKKQALAAVGQSQVMQHWQKLFDQSCAQILLTRSDIESERRRSNAKNTLEALFAMGAIPIINENDSVVIDELVVGDNDNLAAQVAVLCQANTLIICSDVDGLYDKNPSLFSDAELISEVETICNNVLGFASDTDNPIATGGMRTKLQAAQFATQNNVDTFIVNGKSAHTFEKLKSGTNPGTWFKTQTNTNKSIRAQLNSVGENDSQKNAQVEEV